MSSTLHVGLTGGIASGKSAVSARLAEHGALVIDADELAREALAPHSDGLADVVEAFGPEVLDDDGALDRPALGRIVFADLGAREKLNGIVHPRVRERARLHREAAEPGTVVVEDIPLLVENGRADRFEFVIVVEAPQQERMRRMVEIRGAPEDEARSRIDAQATDAQRAAAADVVLDNSGTLEELHDQVDQLWGRLQAELAER